MEPWSHGGDSCMSNPIKDHFNQPAGLAGTTLSYGVLGAWIAGFIAVPEHRDILWLFFPFTGLIAIIAIAVRVIRPFKGREAIPPSQCPICGASKPTAPVRYLQLTGLVVVMLMRELSVFSCRSCSAKAFVKMTRHTLCLGWWGLISLFITPGFILNNLAFLLRGLLSGSPRRFANHLLDKRRDYVLNMLASKDENTVVEVLQSDTGLPAQEITRYLRALRTGQ
ncbi:MAG: hypothetical protein A2289_19895 [Deltaproteobacteria bacterium RIFOXYA12_FULL_58_15]|nr:MAG: hypothetical protein A2289_19895 [Deltaproteobacteria bacterium RIFOXYA12_FULL_58_15]